MIKSFLSWGTALLVLCSGLLSSCDDKNEGGGNPDPTVTIAIGDAAFNALKFTLTLKMRTNAATSAPRRPKPCLRQRRSSPKASP